VRNKGFVQLFRRRWQAIIRGDFTLQIASIASCNLKLSCTEDLLTFMS